MPDAKLQALKGSLTVNEDLLHRALRHAIYLERLKTSEVNRLLGFLNTQLLPDLLATLEQRLGRIATRGFDTGLVTTQRYKDMIGALREVVRGGMKEASASTRKRLGEIATTEAEWQAASVRNAAPVDVELTIPNPQLLASVVTERPFEGRILKDWFGGLEVSTQKRLEQAVNLGIGAGETIEQISTRIRGTKENGYTDGIMQATRREAEAIARTAVNHTTNGAREETFKANTDVIKGVQWVATLDSRTTPICQALDGTVFPVGEGERPPAHWNCRSKTVPVTKSYKEMGIDLAEAPPGTRESLNGKVPASLTYDEWLRKQPREFVEDVLGPNRAQLFLDRKVSVKRFVDDGRSLTLEEIRKREGLEPSSVELSFPVVNQEGLDTFEKFQTKTTKEWTPERKALHEKILAKFTDQAVAAEDPTFYMLGGGPAAGKGSIQGSGLVDFSGAIKIDPDEIKAMLPEYKRLIAAGDLKASSFVHEESSYLSKLAMDRIVAKGATGLLDGTGDGSFASLQKKIAQMRAGGHKVVANYVTLDIEAALTRAHKRGLRTGRMVPEEYIKEVHRAISEVVPEALRADLFDEFTLWDNTAEGAPPFKIAEKFKGSELKIFDEKSWQTFLSKADPSYAPGGGNHTLAGVLASPQVKAAEQAARFASAEVSNAAQRYEIFYQRVLDAKAQGQNPRAAIEAYANALKKGHKAVEDLAATEETLKRLVQEQLAAKDPAKVSVAKAPAAKMWKAADEASPWLVQTVSEKALARAHEAASILSKWTSRKIADEIAIEVMGTLETRSFQLSGSIFLTQKATTAQAAHEIGHALQTRFPALLERTQKFLRERAAKDKNGRQSMLELVGPGHREDEVGWADGFLHPYMGKDYQGNGDEILSMGLELLITDPMRLARADPEYFALIVDILHGSTR